MDAVDVGSHELTQWREESLDTILTNYEIVEVVPENKLLGHAPYMIVSERAVKLANPPNMTPDFAMQELGFTSMSPWTAWTRDERVPELRDKQGIRKYYDMKRNDGAVRGTLQLLKTPIRAAHWYIDPASDSALDKNIADFVEGNLFDDLNVDWSQVLDDVLLMFEYGYSVMEKVYTINQDGKIVLQKLAPRHPLDIREWIFDDQGGPAGIFMEPFVPTGNIMQAGSMLQLPLGSGSLGVPFAFGAFIPIRKLAIFSLEPEAGDLRGISVLRSAYKHWYYKDTLYKIDAIQKERHGIGVPVIKLPPGFSADDKKLADELGRNLRTNDRAHIVIPSNWDIVFAKLEGQPVSAIESIKHHQEMIQINILAPFLNAPSSDVKTHDMFFKATRYLAATIANVFNKHIIPQLVDFNFRRGKYPKLRARRIGEWEDLRTLSFALRNFVGAGLITPDDVLEAQLREEADLPPMDKATARILNGQALLQVPTNPDKIVENPTGDANTPLPAAPPKVGLPRQPAPTATLPAPNSGRDASGG